MSRSRSPKLEARAAATVPPTWRMPSAVSRLARGRLLESSIAATRFVADSSPKPSRPTRSSIAELVTVGRVGQQAGCRRAGPTRCSPRPSMSMAPREAKCTIRCTRCAGQLLLTQ